ncbi:RsmB/NOP family class I SAM-dependent RNA methyltransferase [Pokkaliibacter plantistimulans]|uniref:RsmB/NOP family class I SAM-dependent RNA methyltransferase n=1 Tax=Pokkaliibacter plantistimulans TaxID=1635171 RepID=UPI000D7448DF|nr:RsmB/NOP family class I SAM-dependent RNA methyltransferase [Pokkaliibacter plantistimulans]
MMKSRPRRSRPSAVSPAARQLQQGLRVLSQILHHQVPADAALSQHFHKEQSDAHSRNWCIEHIYGFLREGQGIDLLQRHPTLLKTLWVHYLLRHQQISEGLHRHQVDEEFKDTLIPAGSLPAWLEMQVEEQYDDGAENLIKASTRAAEMDLRVNAAKGVSREAVLKQLELQHILAAPTPWSPWGIRLNKHLPINRNALFENGTLEVQDEGSQVVALLANAQSGQTVIDFCAGAGGKTLVLGSQMQSRGRLVAMDVNERRLNNLRPRLKRAGLDNVQTVLLKDEQDPYLSRWQAKADLLLIDAPCSGTGTLRRNPDLKWRLTPESLERLQATQQRILAAASQLVKSGGEMVYATCSLLASENQQQVQAFMDAHPEFSLVPVQSRLQQLGIKLKTTSPWLQLLPSQHGCDGLFVAILRKN